MYIEKIKIDNFRNIINEEIIPSTGINLIIGKNAQGKTNFIESIYVVSNLKSFRGKKLSEIINNNSEKTKIGILFKKNKVSNYLDFEIKNDEKNIYLNKKKANNLSETLGFLDTVLFYPDDIFIVKGSPSLRRSLLDRAIFQTDNKYLPLFQNYLRCLRQRNAALKRTDIPAEVWDDKFTDLATKIIFHRLAYIERINGILVNLFNEVYRCRESVRIKYPALAEDPQSCRLKMAERLAVNRDKERVYGVTLTGPHRDDPQFLLDGKALSLYGSQGQQRSFMLAFKTAQIIDFKQHRGIRPVLLLDDMTSELDEDRKDSFFESLLNQAGQVFVTSTDTGLLSHKRFSGASFFKVENGGIGEYN
ncbi:MAG: DNA replication/repair protein RecF [Desulfuromonadales bacterium]|nr:DNA replication/repair protein RecF [Desulfuromonadales bacterium]